jgi:medium-chain acyl-[acyl-carrier-protein] hydrolase
VPRPRLRLVCFPHAGGSATLYRLWPDSLPRDVEVWAAQLPGRGARLAEPPIRRMEALVGELDSAIRPLLGDRVEFFGHSMGAVVAFELARRLRQRGAPVPSRLFASGRHAPQLADPNPAMHALPHDELIERVRRMGGTPAAIFEEPELLELFLPALRADLEAVETWVHHHEAPLDVEIVASGGVDDPRASAEGLAAWREQTASTFTAHRLPGGHFYLHERPELLALLRRTLDG